jgi:hypothetical protein
MLAWIHQAIAWEHELLESLFRVKSKPRMMGSVRTFDSPIEEDAMELDIWITSLMDSAVEGLCKPLKASI